MRSKFSGNVTETRSRVDPDDRRIDVLLAVVADATSTLRTASTQLQAELQSSGDSRAASRAADGSTAEVEQLRREVAQLKEALRTRGPVEQAKGVLMALHGCDAEAAFSMLTSIASTEHRKVQQVAAELIASVQLVEDAADDDRHANADSVVGAAADVILAHQGRSVVRLAPPSDHAPRANSG